MEERQQSESEQSRDRQIDDLIEELRVLASDLCDIRWAISYGCDKNASAIHRVSRELSESLYQVQRAIERTAFIPWYLRFWRGLHLMRAKHQMRKVTAEQERRARALTEHMQHLAKNAAQYGGRFRSRYQ